MIDITSAQPPEAEAQHEQPAAPEWITLWERPSPSGVTCGVQAILEKGKKLYRAFAWVMLGEVKRLESPTYEACDAADVDRRRTYPGSIIGEQVQAREMAEAEAEQARMFMTDRQRSPLDMQAIAYDLAAQLHQEANEYNRRMDEEARQRVIDEAALSAFKVWLRGAELYLGKEALDAWIYGVKQKRA